jgi:hypothetical protein
MPKYKSIGTTGTRVGLTEQQRAWIEDFSTPRKNLANVLHHGDCVGSDDEIATIFSRRGTYVIAHPGEGVAEMRAKCKVNDLVLPARPYLERNKDIVHTGKQLLLGFPRTEIEITRSGTWATIRYARTLHVPTYVVTPSGKVITWNLESVL